MLLYHTGYEIIQQPDIHYGRKNADFAQGFYLTPDREFSVRWAKEKEGRLPIVNTYELDLSDLKVHRFERNEEWFSYIFQNRRGKTDTLEADVIIGPIANDTIYDTLGIMTSGILSDEEALSLLQLGPEYTQVALKTKKAALHLSWIEAKELTEAATVKNRDIILKEQEEYIAMIGQTMETF